MKNDSIKLNLHEYQQLFSINSMAYFTSDLFMGHYKTLEGLTTFSNDKWTSYLPKKIAEQALQEGVKIFSNEKLFREFKNNIETYYKEAIPLLEKILSCQKISKDECSVFLETLSNNWVYYSKTEFFYVDEVYKLKDINPIVSQNLKELELIKNGSREKMNDLFFQPNSPRRRFIEKISGQFNISSDDIKMYSKEDILNLYSDIKIGEDSIKERSDSYIMYGKGADITYFQGEISKKLIEESNLSVTDTSNILKGIIASKGIVTAPVTIIKFGENAFSRLSDIISKMPEGNVLVADTTGPELLLACKKSSAILTNQGGMMSHAAIVSRELNIPCIVGLKNVTERLKDGDMVEVDADKGIVRKI